MLRRRVRGLVEQTLGIRIFRRPPRGTDFFYDIAACLPDLRVRTVFDVGANVGQSALRFLQAFPEAQIHSFEPVAATYAKLQAAMAQQPRVSTYNFALGSSVHTDRIAVNDKSLRSRITPDGAAAAPEDWPVETVQVDTLDGFCESHGIDHIDFLKSDTEGHELEVLKGAEKALGRAAIDLIKIEVGMNARNNWHVPFETVAQRLRDFDYDLFAIVEQEPSKGWGTPYLYRSDAVFLSPRWQSPSG